MSSNKRAHGIPRIRRALLALGATALVASGLAPARAASFDPPWSKPMVTGEVFTVPGVDNLPDIHGDLNRPDLVVFFAGNQYMLVNELLAAFRKAHPEFGRVLAETLPPGVLARQIARGGLVVGNARITLKPDVFTAGRGRIRALARKGWFTATRDYAGNRLAILTRKGNPLGIRGWRDLARPGVRLCMPNPETEGIAAHAIIPALTAAGGQALKRAIYETKVRDGETFLTRIHHRQTPLRLMRGQCDAGAVWFTEAWFHGRMTDHGLGMVEIPRKENHVMTYSAGIMKDAPHPAAARAFLDFLAGPEGQAIYRRHGFLPAAGS